jgi:hypothetical protein
MADTNQGGGGTAAPPVKTTGGGDDDHGVEWFKWDEDNPEKPTFVKRQDLFIQPHERSRLPEGYAFSFSPATLTGSWFHVLENDEIIWQGLVVAEPQAGVYLVQIEKLEYGAENIQRLVPVEKMVTDDEGYDWRFFDNREAAMAAFTAWETRR